MAEEEVVAAVGSPVPSDHKRKLEDLKPEAPEPAEPTEEQPADSTADTNPEKKDDNVADGSLSEAKRLRLYDGRSGGLVNENGKANEHGKEDNEEHGIEKEKVDNDAQPLLEEAPDTMDKEPIAEDNNELDNTQQPCAGDSKSDNADEPSKEETEKPSEDEAEEHVPEGQTTSRKMEVPNDKVGVLIGKGGDTIRYLQYNSGAKIQIMRDAEADPRSSTRPVELIGSLGSINKAEQLINAVIAEADAGGSPSLVARGLPSAQTTGQGDQLEMQVPNEKVGLIIGRGGETIKALQAKSGARIQLIPQHLPEGDGSKERTVRVTGDKKQIEIAREMIKDVMNQTARPSPLSTSLNQQHPYRPRGPTGPAHWGPRGPTSQPMPYDYPQRGPYPSQNSPYPPPSYGSYPSQQMAPRINYGSSWEHRPPSMQGSALPHGAGYDYYSGQRGHVSDHPVSAPTSTPIPGHGSGLSSAHTMGPPQSQSNYNSGQPHGTDYGHQALYGHTLPQQSYGHGYDAQKYDNHLLPYGQGSSQSVYPQAGNQSGYVGQQPFGKQPSYGMPPQGPPSQSYGPLRGTQPGDMPYQGPPQSSQSYGGNFQQQYAYVSSGPMQQSYPTYTSATDGYNQAPPTSGAGYAQQGGQPVAAYGQPGGQQGYVQGPTASYGSYPSSQQSYAEQPPSNAGYGYQGSQDAPPPTYGAPPSGQQQAYAQPVSTQPSYDQSVPQSGGYGAAPTSVPVSYGKALSPQPGYPQYDATQAYPAPR